MTGETTTLSLPADLLAVVDKLVQQGRAGSRDELIENALRRKLAEVRRSAPEAEFLHMADDADYQREARQILAEFAQSDWQTLNNSPDQGTTEHQPAGRGARFLTLASIRSRGLSRADHGQC